MKIKNNELAAVVYADLFGYPLTVSEAKLWAIRQERKKNSDKKLKLAKTVTAWLAKIPTVEAVFLTGSVAVGNAKKNADIDLMIITKPGTMWLTRLVVVFVLKSKKMYRKIICPNIFLDTNHLEISDKNLYTAHEVLQVKVLFDRSGIEKKWLKKNEWAKEYLPNAYRYYVSCIKYYGHKKNYFYGALYIILYTLYFVPELAAFLFQYFYMKRKMTNESVGWGFAFFHPNQMGKKIESEFRKRLLKYS